MHAEALKEFKEDIEHFERKGKGHLIKRAMTNTFSKMEEAFGSETSLMNAIFAKSNWKNRKDGFTITLVKYLLLSNPNDVDVRNFCVKHGHADLLPKKPKPANQAVALHREQRPKGDDDVYEIEEKRVEITRTIRRVGRGEAIEHSQHPPNVTRLPRRGE